MVDAIEAPGVRVLALAPAPAFLLCGDAPTLALACAALGVDPPAPCASRAAGPLAVLWLAPDRLLLLGDAQAASRLRAPLGERPHALVDVSDGEAALELEGPAAARLLACAIMLDLDTGAFPPGACARTLLGKAPALLLRTGEARFVLRTPRSYATYACALLAEGARGLAP